MFRDRVAGVLATAAERALIEQWIAAGAVWPADMPSLADLIPKKPRPDKGRDHWAFQPLVRPPVPGASAGTTPIDAFVQEKLTAAGIAMNPEADPRTLIRRVSFDLVGLPPTPAEVTEFEEACRLAGSTDWPYCALVDRLLFTPGFGERWARHWLDVVRFAESDGFVQEQLCGDRLGADAATGFIVGGPTDRVLSPDPVLTANQRADELHDMVSTAGSAFLGLTVGCARCHDHKFDPRVADGLLPLEGGFRGGEARRA